VEKNTKIVCYYKNPDGNHIFGPTTATIFYGQCGEDLEVYCDFFHQKRSWYQSNKGTYIEIGASDGVKFSNTKFFEEDMGFSGVLIEPEPQMFETLKKTRPANYLYNCAVDSSEQPVTFLVSNGPGAGWVSGIEKRMSEHHKQAWHQDTQRIIVNTAKMSSLMRDSGLERVDLYSIDVEGGEYEVLSTTNWNIPIYVIIIELAKGDTETEKDIKCRKLLAEKGYTFHKRINLSEIWYDETYFDKVTDEKNNLI
jgi:FkbM family methyltransferase